ncbi:hypothetical protein ACIF6H_36100 [Streptomyces microflavus]|uniref:hypothetical protein n=1 Tax=Streptomyces TaxID=1883 RepID=UPI00117E2EBF|nr:MULTISPECIES: hypothetical protein [unclassified Streptomyces]
MNRTRLTEHFATRANDNGVVVASSFHHPSRGYVWCPASPLLAAWLISRGVPASVQPLEVCLQQSSSQAPEEGVLFATSYQDVDHGTIGIAALAQGPLRDRAEQAIRAWTACLRTRRLLVPLVGTACASPLVPLPPQGREERTPLLKSKHRASSVCGLADAARDCIVGFKQRGDTVLLIGDGGLAAGSSSSAAWLDDQEVVAVADVRAAVSINVDDAAAVAFVVNPCSSTEEVAQILAVLRTRFPLLRGQHPDQWCYRTTDSHNAVRTAVAQSDLALAVQNGQVHWLPEDILSVRSLGDLDPTVIASAATITLVGAQRGLPVPGVGVNDLIGSLSGLGPTSVVYQRVVSNISTDFLKTADTSRNRVSVPPSTSAESPSERRAKS